MADLASPHVIILGAGPAGVGGAFQLRRLGAARVTVLEQRSVVGGNAGSFEAGGLRLDYGSHRLHPACDPDILADIRNLLGDELLDRPRHGRIRLRGRWIHFPLKPVDLLLRLDPAFAAGSLTDMIRRPAAGGDAENFATIMRASLGPTICDEFYFPYARKIWGVDPAELSPVQARRRVSANSFGKLIRKVLEQLPGLKRPGAGRFFYPRYGYGSISEAYAAAAREAGADVRLGLRVESLDVPLGDEPWRVRAVPASPPWEPDPPPGGEVELEADHLWSTIPIPALARAVRPAAPEAVLHASDQIRFRAMLLVYLELPVDRFTEFDAHYLPGTDVAITRLSEPKNYAALEEPRGVTTLCAELPCEPGDRHWECTDEELGELVALDLETVGIPLPAPPARVFVRRLRQAYPIYLQGYERHFETLDRWADSLPRMLTYGRQGLFAHDNTHHALFMAYAAAECMRGGRFDDERWQSYRQIFESHVVED